MVMTFCFLNTKYMVKILGFLLLLGLSACSGKETLFVKTVQNDSSKEITLYFFGEYNPKIYGDTVTIAPNTKKDIYSYYEENSSTAVAQPCEIFKDNNDTLSVAITGGGRLNKSFYDGNDWNYVSSGRTQNCIFVITNADIQ